MEVKDPPTAPTDHIIDEYESLDPIQDMLAKSLIYDYLVRNSLDWLATKFQKLSEGKGISIHDMFFWDNAEYGGLFLACQGLKLEHFVDQLIVDPDDKPHLTTSIVYDFLKRKADPRIAFEFKVYYHGTLKDVSSGLTLEDLMKMYKK